MTKTPFYSPRPQTHDRNVDGSSPLQGASSMTNKVGLPRVLLLQTPAAEMKFHITAVACSLNTVRNLKS